MWILSQDGKSLMNMKTKGLRVSDKNIEATEYDGYDTRMGTYENETEAKKVIGYVVKAMEENWSVFQLPQSI